MGNVTQKRGVGQMSHHSATVLRPYFPQTRAIASGVHFAPTHIYKNKNKKIYIYIGRVLLDTFFGSDCLPWCVLEKWCTS